MDRELEEIIEEAIKLKVSDIHFDVRDHKTYIDFRRHKVTVLTKISPSSGFITQLKYQAKFNMTQSHSPNSGSFMYSFDRWYYFRFAAIETMNRRHGVLRILNVNELDSLADCLKNKKKMTQIEKMVQEKHGLILFCGATGSGKSTTMINALKTVSKRKIFTLENPIEQLVEDFVQLDVGVFDSLNLEKTITQLLRHDPDVLMIGEIRTQDELHQALRASLSGHLVVSTLHCASVEHLIYRLIDLGASYYDLLYALKGFVFQTLKGEERGVKLTCEIYQNKEIEQLLLAFKDEREAKFTS